MASRRHFFLWDILTQDRRCLWCGGGDVHPSTHPLRLLSVLRYETWRCHGCGRRFPLRPGRGATPPEFAQAARRRQPAGEELRPLDDTLAKLLKPGPIDGPDGGAS